MNVTDLAEKLTDEYIQAPPVTNDIFSSFDIAKFYDIKLYLNASKPNFKVSVGREERDGQVCIFLNEKMPYVVKNVWCAKALLAYILKNRETPNEPFFIKGETLTAIYYKPFVATLLLPETVFVRDVNEGLNIFDLNQKYKVPLDIVQYRLHKLNIKAKD